MEENSDVKQPAQQQHTRRRIGGDSGLTHAKSNFTTATARASASATANPTSRLQHGGIAQLRN